VEACSELGDLASDRFRSDELVMLGTLRPDGSARISPCEVDVAAGHLFLGMMWRSPKALDLYRDPRIVVHTVTCNREGTYGDLKLYGRALDVPDPRSGPPTELPFGPESTGLPKRAGTISFPWMSPPPATSGSPSPGAGMS
jgi:hypothetical protein